MAENLADHFSRFIRLTWTCEHQGSHATYLDLDINVSNGIFVYKLFDKRDNFPFFIIRMPDLSGNIPSHVFYGSVMSEFLRISRSTLLYSDFLPFAVSLYKRMISQGGCQIKIINQISKAITKHTSPFAKYSKQKSEIINDITSG